MLHSRRLRSSARYEVVVAERLLPQELRALGGRLDLPDLYGILRPTAGGGGVHKAIDSVTALVLLTLREPGALPRFARERWGGECEATLALLVADGILEVEFDGEFRGGAPALAALGLVAAVATPASTRLARLSAAALSSAARLPTGSVVEVAFHLYAAGRSPVTPRWRRQLQAVPDELAAALRGSAPLRAAWRLSQVSERWLHWRSRDPEIALPAPGEATFKLYVSPPAADLPHLWPLLAAAAAEVGAFEIKAGAGAAGLLRPDKLVAYFASLSRLRRAADRLAVELSGLPPHGVPFTAEIAAAGLLSWGVDPGDDPAAPRWRPAGPDASWRAWLCGELASSLVAARRDGVGGEGAVAHALAHARLLGLDVESWTPGEALRRTLGSGR